MKFINFRYEKIGTLCDIFLSPSLLQAIEGEAGATVENSMVTQITTTATRTTTDGPVSRPIPEEAKWEVALGELLEPPHIEEKLRRKPELGQKFSSVSIFWEMCTKHLVGAQCSTQN